jgi:hypothetical protein
MSQNLTPQPPPKHGEEEVSEAQRGEFKQSGAD